MYNLATINYNAFQNCSNLINISNLNNLRTLGYSAFYNCTLLKELHCLYSLKNFELYYSDESFYGSPFKGSSIEYLYDLNSLENIPNYGFYNCECIKGLYNVTKLTNIGNYAFINCYNLKDLNDMSQILSIGQFAFSYCRNFNGILKFHNSVNISQSAFSNCEKLNGILDFHNSVNISQYAFAGCVSIKEVVFRGSNISVQSESLSNVKNITIYYPVILNSKIVNNKLSIDIYYYGKEVPSNDIETHNLIYSIVSNVYVLCDYKSTQFYGHEVTYLACNINKLTQNKLKNDVFSLKFILLSFEYNYDIIR